MKKNRDLPENNFVYQFLLIYFSAPFVFTYLVIISESGLTFHPILDLYYEMLTGYVYHWYMGRVNIFIYH